MIYLSSPVLKVTDIKKRTTAEVIKDTEIGDKIQFYMPLKSPGRGSRGTTYASYFTFDNLTKGIKTQCSLNTCSRIFDILDLEVIL